VKVVIWAAREKRKGEKKTKKANGQWQNGGALRISDEKGILTQEIPGIETENPSGYPQFT